MHLRVKDALQQNSNPQIPVEPYSDHSELMPRNGVDRARQSIHRCRTVTTKRRKTYFFMKQDLLFLTAREVKASPQEKMRQAPICQLDLPWSRWQ